MTHGFYVWVSVAILGVPLCIVLVQRRGRAWIVFQFLRLCLCVVDAWALRESAILDRRTERLIRVVRNKARWRRNMFH
ncbi:hypothetical protein [Novacetimonas hansenii]|uniref:Uncharacterized protein n=1 Tax=Novacetimonas hansenii TaxID=436 RepID=A0AAW5ENF6_NOVHA|nr:hypothetical protein [Novacetimonas hansenii]MCJ8352716.1 hypothetical protein [Novacetimonas hansenii]PYD72871.1 hypothetical protein CFR74_07675 [Novacetimonas hansenii]